MRLGLVVGLGLIPAAVFGPARTATYFQEWAKVLILPGLGAGEDSSRDKELIDATATDSQSFQSTIHNTMYPDWATRPPRPSRLVRGAHWLLAGGLTLTTLWACRRRRGDRPAEVVAVWGTGRSDAGVQPDQPHALFLSDAAAGDGNDSPVAADGDRRLGAALLFVGTANMLANVLPLIPGLEVTRDCGAVF